MEFHLVECELKCSTVHDPALWKDQSVEKIVERGVINKALGNRLLMAADPESEWDGGKPEMIVNRHKQFDNHRPDFTEQNNVINSFKDQNTGLAVLLSGLTVEEAIAVGAEPSDEYKENNGLS